MLTLLLLSYQWVAILIQALITFGLSVMIARFLSVDQFGVYATATSVGNLFRIFLDGGFSSLLQRESAKKTLDFCVEKDVIVRYALGYAFLIGLMLCVGILINPFDHNKSILFGIIFSFAPTVLIEISMAVLRGQGRLAKDAVLQIISRFFTAFCILLFLFLGSESAISILIAQGIGGFTIYLILAYRSRARPLFLVPLSLLRVSFPFLSLSLFVFLYSRSDLILVRIYDIPVLDIGIYGLACKLIEAIHVFTAPIAFISFRKFRTHGSKEKIIQQIFKFTYYGLGTGLLVCGCAFLLSSTIIPWVFGDKYAASVTLFNILSIGLIFFFGNTVLFQALIAMEQHKPLLLFASLAGISSVVLNIAFLPIYGIETAAWVSVLIQCLLMIMLIFFVSRSATFKDFAI